MSITEKSEQAFILINLFLVFFKRKNLKEKKNIKRQKLLPKTANGNEREKEEKK